MPDRHKELKLVGRDTEEVAPPPVDVLKPGPGPGDAGVRVQPSPNDGRSPVCISPWTTRDAELKKKSDNDRLGRPARPSPLFKKNEKPGASLVREGVAATAAAAGTM